MAECFFIVPCGTILFFTCERIPFRSDLCYCDCITRYLSVIFVLNYYIEILRSD